MCKRCVENCRKHIPDIPEKEWYDYLMEFTCFPFGSAQMVEDQLVTLAYHEYFKEEGHGREKV